MHLCVCVNKWQKVFYLQLKQTNWSLIDTPDWWLEPECNQSDVCTPVWESLMYMIIINNSSANIDVNNNNNALNVFFWTSRIFFNQNKFGSFTIQADWQAFLTVSYIRMITSSSEAASLSSSLSLSLSEVDLQCIWLPPSPPSSLPLGDRGGPTAGRQPTESLSCQGGLCWLKGDIRVVASQSLPLQLHWCIEEESRQLPAIDTSHLTLTVTYILHLLFAVNLQCF